MENPPEKPDAAPSNDSNRKPIVVARMSDLYFVSRVEVAANHFDCQVEFLPGPAREGLQIMGPIGEMHPSVSFSAEDLPKSTNIDLVIVDLNQPDAVGWIANFREVANAEVRIIAFGSHVDIERLAAAREAGATRAIARSRFVEILPGLFQDLSD